LPLHTSHILQPLDVVLFQPFKHFHAKAVDHTTRTGCSHFDKLEFLAAITSIQKETFKKTSILSAFREYGLIPYNLQIILDKVQYQAPPSLVRPAIPPELQNLPPTTPCTDRSLEKQARLLQNATPNAQRLLREKFIKGALIQAEIAAQIQLQLAETTAAEKECRARSCQTQHQLQKGGTLYPAEARAMIQQREEDGGTQLEWLQRRAQQLQKELYAERAKSSNLARRCVDLMTEDFT
jgi:chaperonin cofactor prefoldin